MARFKGGAVAENEDEEDPDEGGAEAAGEGGGWASAAPKEDEEDLDAPAPDSVASGAGYNRSQFFRSGCVAVCLFSSFYPPARSKRLLELLPDGFCRQHPTYNH